LHIVPVDGDRNLGRGGAPNEAVVNVFYATDRAILGETNKGATYGSEPAANNSLSLGIAKVSIPRAHKMGEVEGPSIIRLEFSENPEKHVVLLSATPEGPDQFYRRVSDRISQSLRHEAFVFVHGFNVTFEDAVHRTAQMAYDLGFDGAPILYSWPSHGRVGVVDYNADGRNAELSVVHMQSFLTQLAARTGVRTIHMIAHSMGNRIAVKALANMQGSAAAHSLHVRELALMAPDIDAAEFRRLAVALKSSADHVTLYASSRDAALQASAKLAGYSRAGEGGDHIVVMPGVLDTIDCSAVDTSLLGLGHSYYADNGTILSDLYRLIRGDSARDRFRLRPVHNSQGDYWAFVAAAR
jgi:esterase/lipase superfamily enzyme